MLTSITTTIPYHVRFLDLFLLCYNELHISVTYHLLQDQAYHRKLRKISIF